MMTLRGWAKLAVGALLHGFILKIPNATMRRLAAVTIVVTIGVSAPAAAPASEVASLNAKWAALFLAGKYAEAVPVAQRLLAIRQKALGSNHPDVAAALNNLAMTYQSQARFPEAEPLYRRSLAISEETLAPDHPTIVTVLNNLANLYRAQGRYADAEQSYERSLAIAKKKFGSDHPEFASALNNLAVIYRDRGRFVDAEPLFKQSLTIRERTFGPDHPDVAQSLNNLATLYHDAKRPADAEPLYKRTLTIRERTLGLDHPLVSTVLNNLAMLYQDQARYTDAERLYKRTLAIRERAYGSDHPDVATTLNDLASVYHEQGRHADAEPLYKRTLAIREKALGPIHPDVAQSLNSLASLAQEQGRYTDAELLYQRSLAIREKALGPDHPIVAASLNNLATLFQIQRRYADAESVHQRSLAIKQKAFGPDHPDVAVALMNLANLYLAQGRFADAEARYQRAREIREKVLGSDHPEVAVTLTNLANLYWIQRRYSDAEPLYQRSLTIHENVFGPDTPLLATTLNNLANNYSSQGRYADAEAHYRRALAINEKALGSKHPNVATSLHNLANLYAIQGRYAQALPFIDLAIAGPQARPSDVLPILLGALRKHLIAPDKALDGAINVVQRANQTSAAAAVGKLAVRFAAGNDRLAQLVRRDQDLSGEAETLDKAIITAVSKEPAKRDAAGEQRTRDRLAAVAAERASLQKTFASEFPDYAALSDPLPLTAKQIQPLLSDDEALLLYAVGGDKTSYVFALTRDRFEWTEVPLGGEALSDKVAAFRRGLDVNLVGDSNPASGRTGFDLGIAHELYLSLFGPVEALIKDKKQLLVVPSGALSALPFHLLVSEKPVAARPDKIEGFRDAAWLIKRQALAVLPSLASLRALRAFGQLNQNRKPLVGFGDPVFNPAAAVSVALRAEPRAGARNLSTRAYTDFWQGAAIDRAKLSQQLPVLPDTAVELKSIAQKLGASGADLHFGRDASETTVKRLPLAEYRIVYFATHALVAGDVKGVAEPSLVLSIPANPTEFDDGLLTASEVAQLKLNADWVVLSACNTIAGDKPGAEALSGLARSFFYAGARALLVSHWAVESDAATRLTTSTFEILKSDPKLGRAAALRQAMMDFLNDSSSPKNAHPAIWGPFALIGEGSAR